MRIETIPIVLGILVGLIGLALIVDAASPDRPSRIAERRRRERPQRHRGGEAILGLGMIAMGIALFERDTWRYTNLALAVALVAFAVGPVLNYKYLRGRFFGPTRGLTAMNRATDLEPEPPEPKIRLR